MHVLLSRLVNNLISLKFFILLAACAFLYIGKIDEHTWQETVLITAGFRVVNEVASMVKSSKESIEAIRNNAK